VESGKEVAVKILNKNGKESAIRVSVSARGLSRPNRVIWNTHGLDIKTKVEHQA
jgi:hypothetical protein